MECFVCGAAAEEFDRGGDYRHVDCPDCGTYKIGGSLLATMHGRVFDVVATRERFSRARLREDKVPLLSSYDADLLRESDA